ncbi:hypothetical protein DL96DRAFT_1618584 [Flagelloscypha sp. PMI_526]|nr:hypothetical protein DL96DRAFT_1618584 [Flagelloscypha sp. PMI_526]
MREQIYDRSYRLNFNGQNVGPAFVFTPRQQPIAVITEGLDNLSHVKMVLGGKYLVGTGGYCFRVWEIEPFSSSPEVPAQARMIATTAPFRFRVTYSSVLTHDTENGLSLQLNSLSPAGVEMFRVILDRGNISESPIPSYKFSPNNRFYWWPIFGSEDTFGIFDTLHGKTRHIKLSGIPISVWDPALILDISGETLLVRHGQGLHGHDLRIPQKHGRIFLFPLPPPSEHEIITTVGPSSVYNLEWLNYRSADWTVAIHVIGATFVSVLLTNAKRPEHPKHDFYLFEVQNNGTELIKRGQIPFPQNLPADAWPSAEYRIGQSSVFAGLCNMNHIRFMWSSEMSRQVMICTIPLEGCRYQGVKIQMMDHSENPETKNDDTSSGIISTDAFSGRCAHLVHPGTTPYFTWPQLEAAEKEMWIFEWAEGHLNGQEKKL